MSSLSFTSNFFTWVLRSSAVLKSSSRIDNKEQAVGLGQCRSSPVCPDGRCENVHAYSLSVLAIIDRCNFLSDTVDVSRKDA